MIHVLIPVFNRKQLTLECLESFSKQEYRDFDITVVDDGSTDGTSDAIHAQFPDVRIIEGGGWWWAKSLNNGLDLILPLAAKNDFMLITNNDTTIKPDYLAEMLRSSIEHHRAIVGSLLRDSSTGEIIPKSSTINWHTYSLGFGEHIDFLTTRGILIPIEVFEKVKGFTKLLPHHTADLNFSMRAERAGFTLVLNRDTAVHSKEKSGEKIWSFGTRYFSRRSSSNLGANIMFAILNAPTVWLKILSVLRIIYRFFKDLLVYEFKT